MFVVVGTFHTWQYTRAVSDQILTVWSVQYPWSKLVEAIVRFHSTITELTASQVLD